MTRDLISLRDTLAGLLPDGDRITGLRAFSTGHSNETYLIEGLDQILRLPPASDPLLPDTHGVAAQAAIYRALSGLAGAPPVPEILFDDADPTHLGDPFFVMARVAGEEVNDYQPQPWFADAEPSYQADICHRWIDAFAALAGVAPLAVLGAVQTPEDEVRRWRSMALDADCGELATQFDRLLAIAAPRTGNPSPVHGDPKLANLMWDDRALSAVLDWELAYNGEPLADLGYMLYFFAAPDHGAKGAFACPGMWTRDQVITHWASRTGRDPSGVAWHEIAAVGKIAAILAYGYNLSASGKSDDARFLRWRELRDENIALIGKMLAKL